MVSACGPRATRTFRRLGAVLLLLTATAWRPSVAHADLYSASSEYEKGDYAHAFADFLSLAELGQPRAQSAVAAMYRAGQGVTPSDIHAYAWAVLAAENGEAKARRLADEIRPELAPGSERIAGWFTANYTPTALRKRLMPVSSRGTREAMTQWIQQCDPVRTDEPEYPQDAEVKGIEGNVFAAFTLMPDGKARGPRVILDPTGVFGTTTRESILRDTFKPLPAGSHPVQCVIFQRFDFGDGDDRTTYVPGRPLNVMGGYEYKVRKQANAGDPNAQLFYGMVLVGLPRRHQTGSEGLPWFLRAAQAGLPVAQFEVGFSLLTGFGCERDEAKALTWLRMAADQNEPNAEVTLAIGAMRGVAGFGDSAQAKGWLQKAAAQGNHDGELYLAALLAAAPDPRLRDSNGALELMQRAVKGIYHDPTPFEVRAAAQAAAGDFADAVKSEKGAISRAYSLGWDLSPLQERLAAYQAGKPWYGDLLDY